MILPPLNPALLHLDSDHLWLMHCVDGPVPRSVVRMVRGFLHKELWPWELDFQGEFLGVPEALRQEAAKLVGGDSADISLTPNTSTGLATVAQGFPWRAGDEVLAPLGEFPSNVYPWKGLESRLVQLREVPLWEGHKAGASGWDTTPPSQGDEPEARLIDALGSRTRVLATSWVRFQDGLKLDLARLGSACRRRGIHLVVDGIQGAGTAVPDLYGVSAFATGGHKGLLAPQGQGFLWTEPEFRRQLAPTGTWLSVQDATDPQRPGTDYRPWLEDGRRLEPGGPNVMACVGLLEAIRTLHQAGIGTIAEHVRSLQVSLLDHLDGVPAWAGEVRRLRGLLERDRLGSILAFHHGDRTPEEMQDLLERGCRRGVYGSLREGYLRVAFHGWHEAADVHRIVDWLKS
ncbi:MAG: aminotransferase class V-fold PLP-dependent enzyme [Holophaga sp.]|jgi:selenocysteine lyase/cysteine desulfurase